MNITDRLIEIAEENLIVIPKIKGETFIIQAITMDGQLFTESMPISEICSFNLENDADRLGTRIKQYRAYAKARADIASGTRRMKHIEDLYPASVR